MTVDTRRSSPPQPEVRAWTLAANTEDELTFTGQRLALETSRRDQHTHHPTRIGHPGDRKCHACRWLEVAIYRRYILSSAADDVKFAVDPATVDTDYVLHTVGGTTVPGERQLVRVVTTPSAHELLELLTVRKNPQDPFIAAQSLRALARAARFDPEVENAYVNRAIT